MKRRWVSSAKANQLCEGGGVGRLSLSFVQHLLGIMKINEKDFLIKSSMQ